MGLLGWLFGKKKTAAGRPIPEASRMPRSLAPATPAAAHRIPFIVWREGSHPMNAVGESQFQGALSRIVGPHSRHGHRIEANAILVREPNNPHDSNAVAVEIYGEKVGYLSRDDALRVAGRMDEEELKRVGCGALISGGWRTNQYDEGSFGVRLGIPRWDWIDMGTGSAPPPQQAGPRRAPNRVKRPEPAETGPLVGQWVVLWGLSDTGAEAIELAALGAKIMAGVGVSTTMLIHAEDNLTAGAIGSATYRKAQERIAAGAKIEIISIGKLRERLGT